jgi:hypothetical protein
VTRRVGSAIKTAYTSPECGVTLASLIHELQTEALAQDVSLSELLRKAYVVARKLKLLEFGTWIKRELDGYGDAPPSDYPRYRVLMGIPKMVSPYHGCVPITFFKNAKVEQMLSTLHCRQSIAEIEHSLEGVASDGVFETHFSGEVQQDLMESTGWKERFVLHVAPYALHGILDSVRNIVLQWALQLEEDGILGEGISFSTKEVTAAQASSYTVNYFAGDVSHSQVQQGTSSSQQSKGLSDE